MRYGGLSCLRTSNDNDLEALRTRRRKNNIKMMTMMVWMNTPNVARPPGPGRGRAEHDAGGEADRRFGEGDRLRQDVWD